MSAIWNNSQWPNWAQDLGNVGIWITLAKISSADLLTIEDTVSEDAKALVPSIQCKPRCTKVDEVVDVVVDGEVVVDEVDEDQTTDTITMFDSKFGVKWVLKHANIK